MNIKRIRRVALWASLFLVVVSLVAVFLPVPPHGRFSNPDIGNMAHAYFEASAGKFTQVVFGGEHGREGEEFRQFVGDYRKEGGRWILTTPDGSTGELRATLLSLHIIDPRTRPAGPFYRYEIYTGR
jgi:hypothetical protein